jgi:hypothetical protein
LNFSLSTGHYNEYSHKATEYDEGYEQEDEDTISIDRALSVIFFNIKKKSISAIID